MKEKKLTLLLDIIQHNGNINRLTREGVSFKEVTDLTNEAVEKGYLAYEHEKITLTSQGIAYLAKTVDKIKRTDKAGWIAKDDKSQTAKLDKNAIFVPRQDELTF
ncbi:MAG: hypothetical protein HYZ14_04800 [Bacteroidetes bacterium]|nr:hypothetical protein [Bacteroidota bacterium]